MLGALFLGFYHCIVKINQRNLKINFFIQNKFRIFVTSKAIKLRYKFNKMENIIIDNKEEITIQKDYRGTTLELFYCKESNFYMATANVSGKQIATAMFENSKRLGGWCGNEIEVDKQYRRKGIMTELYNWVETKVNEKIVPTKTLTKASRAFWKNRQNAN